MNDDAQGKMISVLIPVYNEQDVIDECFARVNTIMSSTSYRYEILFVNDGSSDDSWEKMQALAASCDEVGCLNLSRNFGKEHAMTAGLDYSKGDAVIILDADLQDPPEMIPEFIKFWEQGYDNVYGRRRVREGERWFKKATAYYFYRFMQAISRVEIPADTGDFRLLSRRAVDAVLELKEQHRFMKGIFAWVGYKQKEVLYKRESRFAGSTKFNYWKLWNFALEGITSFTYVPLKMATYFGLCVSILSFLYGGYIIFKTLVFGEDVAGYPSLMTAILFMGGVQLLFTGVLGEYIGRTFEEVKKRPLYIIDTYVVPNSIYSNKSRIKEDV